VRGRIVKRMMRDELRERSSWKEREGVWKWRGMICGDLKKDEEEEEKERKEEREIENSTNFISKHRILI
jgi:hypothetical protein